MLTEDKDNPPRRGQVGALAILIIFAVAVAMSAIITYKASSVYHKRSIDVGTGIRGAK